MSQEQVETIRLLREIRDLLEMMVMNSAEDRWSPSDIVVVDVERMEREADQKFIDELRAG